MGAPDFPEVAHCSECTAPVVLAFRSGQGYLLICGCEMSTVDVNACVNESALFDPLGGKWSSLD